MTMTADAPLFTADDVVYAYTRAEAVADGVLVDVTETARGAGFKWPVALTAGAWEEFVAWSEEDTLRKGWPQDETGRLWDVLYMAAMAARKGDEEGDGIFEFIRVPRAGASRKPERVQAKLHCGPGDDGKPTVVISLPLEG